jgi:hypothetical protein
VHACEARPNTGKACPAGCARRFASSKKSGQTNITTTSQVNNEFPGNSKRSGTGSIICFGGGLRGIMHFDEGVQRSL